MMSSEGKVCFFCKRPGTLLTAGTKRISNIIKCSKECGDNLHEDLVEETTNDIKDSIKCHKNCVSTYTSTDHRSRVVKRKSSLQHSDSEPCTRKCRSASVGFDFNDHCFICGDKCIPRDPKNPFRWRTVLKCSIDRPGCKAFKETLLSICRERNDDQGREVQARLLGAVADLHAAGACYHKDCYKRFSSQHNYQSAQRCDKESSTNDPFTQLFTTMKKDPSHVWTSLELQNLYKSCGGQLSRRSMMQKLSLLFGNDLLVINIAGCASQVMFKEHAPKCFNLVEFDESDESHLQAILRAIRSEVKSIQKKNVYDFCQFTMEKAIADTSSTLLTLISALVSDGNITRESLSLSQSIQQHIKHQSNQTTLGLAVKLHHILGSKEVISILNSYGYTTTYDEVLRFRSSVAKYTIEHDLGPIPLQCHDNLVNCWCDNFDLHVNTPNGKSETHAMAIEFTQSAQTEDLKGPRAYQDYASQSLIIPRLSKIEIQEMKLGEVNNPKMEHYYGPKAPNPPLIEIKNGLEFSELFKTYDSLNEALKKDIEWLQIVISADNHQELCSEWSGHMCKIARESRKLGNTSNYALGPLIDAPPSHPDTVLTTMQYCENYLKNLGVKYVHLTADMQIYKVIMKIKWSNPERWKFFVVSPGGMHTLMSFIGCIGTLMKGSGLEEIMSVAFSGVGKMLNGKTWPKAVRGLRMVTVALLGKIINGMIGATELQAELLRLRCLPTARLWIDCLILPTMVIHLFIRSAREGDWLLHLYCLERMLPYFFAAGHWQYARFIQWHILEMRQTLPEEVKTSFMDGSHTVRHKMGSWNGVWIDQFGEQTYIRYGKARGGLVGMTLSTDQVSRWLLSYHACQLLSLSMDTMFTDHVENNGKKPHKEEGKNRQKMDATDRKTLKEYIDHHIHPLNLQSDRLINIINGQVAGENINVHDSVEIGERMSARFRDSLPKGFYNPLQQQVKTMETLKKGVHIGNSVAYDMETLYSRILIISQKRSISLEDVFQYELSAMPFSLFDEYGLMRKGNKSLLMNKLALFNEGKFTPDVEIIDGNQLLYHVIWPHKGNIQSLANNLADKIGKKHEIHVVFDKYHDESIKNYERGRRARGSPTEHQLTLTSVLPDRDIIMKSANNKRQLINLLCLCSFGSNICLFGEDNSIYSHEEADVTVVSHMLQQIHMQRQKIQIQADDTDIFVMLLYWYWKLKPESKLVMKRSNGQLISVNDTANALGEKCIQLLAVHSLSGCDSNSFPFGIGKATALKILLNHNCSNLEIYGEPTATQSEILNAGKNFFCHLYGAKHPQPMNKLRYQLFIKNRNKAPSLKSLPPTDSNLKFHLLRAHYQVMLWKSADQVAPPAQKLTDFGWQKLEDGIYPVTTAEPPAPKELMKVIACSCKSVKPCSRTTCSCKAAQVSCTDYCKCQAGELCTNEHTVHTVESDEDQEYD